MKTNQIEMVSIKNLVLEKHTYRKLKVAINFDELVASIKIKDQDIGATGFQCSSACNVLDFVIYGRIV